MVAVIFYGISGSTQEIASNDLFPDYAPTLTLHNTPNISGVWQSFTTANWNILSHPVQAGPFAEQSGAWGAGRAGFGIVEGNELPFDKLKQAFADGVSNSEIVPVLFCSSTSQVGIESLAKAIGDLFPGPESSIFSKRSNLLGKKDPALQIFKTRHEGKMGEVQYARVASGKINKGDTLKNTRTADNERLTQLYKVNIGDREGVDSVEA